MSANKKHTFTLVVHALQARKKICLPVQCDTTVGQVKEALQEKTGIVQDQIMLSYVPMDLVHKGIVQFLQDISTMEELNLFDMCVVNFKIRVRGRLPCM